MSLLKTLVCLQPSPEAGDKVVRVHILCSTEQLLCWHIAWQSSKGSCVMTERLGGRQQGWVTCSKSSISLFALAWSIPLTRLVPKPSLLLSTWAFEFPSYQTISIPFSCQTCHDGLPHTVALPQPLEIRESVWK